MTQEHPITPPPELVKQWVSLACEYEGNETWIDLATQAARWGADMELEACCREVQKLYGVGRWLRSTRRIESLKEQALSLLDEAENTIRRALESLPD